MKILNLCLAFLLSTGSSFCGVLEISGYYQGKNVFVQNPYNIEKKEFCTEEVYINGEKVLSEIKSSAFSINLAHLEVNDVVNIKIVYKDDCEPRIINAYVLQKTDENYTFTHLAFDNKQIYWSLNEGVLGGRFIVEKFTENYWKPVATTAVILNEEKYSTSLSPFISEGENKFRIKYLSPKEKVYISQNVISVGDENPITVSIDSSEKILLSKEINYEILDAEGNIIQNGLGKEVAISDLQSGTYYINYANKSEKFVKK